MSDSQPNAAIASGTPQTDPAGSDVQIVKEEYKRSVEDGQVLAVAVATYHDKATGKDVPRRRMHTVAIDAVGRRIRNKLVRYASDAELRMWRLGEDDVAEDAVGVAAEPGATPNQTFGVNGETNPKALRSSERGAAGETTTTDEPASSLAPAIGAAADTPVNSPLRASHTEVADPANTDAAVSTTATASGPGDASITSIAPGESDASRLADPPKTAFAVTEPEKDFTEMRIAEVEHWLDANDFDRSTVKGTGSNGNVLLSDLVKAAQGWYKQHPPRK